MEINSTLNSEKLFASYESKAGRFDEYLTPEGTTRLAWSSIASHFDKIGGEGLRRLANNGQRMLRENGATFMSTGDGGTQNRPWQLSCVPFVLDAATWQTIESGLMQRVRILEVALADLLGPQKLIRNGILPAELLSANPEHARAFHGLPVRGSNRLHLTAMDLARNADGQWWVLGHRTRAPSGLGYALENRVVTSRLLQRQIQKSQVPRLASFFSRFDEHLRSLAPRRKDNPRIAILTPGQSSYRYFEDVYLAKYLGYTLVQGRDLAMRGDSLNLKTLGGLVPIEVLWRHVSDKKCDRLELDPAANEGASGMLQTIRSGNLAVANDIGSVLAEMPALLPFLPAVAKEVFGEEMILPSIATYWCGTDEERSHVLANLDDLLIRPAFAVSGALPIDANQLSVSAREELITQINARPQHFVAQPRPARSITPVWHNNELQSWSVAFRTFQLQTSHGIDVMPGGLIRVSDDADSLDGNPRTGHLGQDCWVIGEQPQSQTQSLLPPANQLVELVRSGEELPSRVAEQFFWLGRYVERAGSIARLLRTTMVRLSGEDEADGLPDIPPLVKALAAVGQIEPDYAISDFANSLRQLEQELPQTLFNREQPHGLRSATESIVSNAVAVRDRLSTDGYRVLTRINRSFSNSALMNADLGSAIEAMDQLIADLMAVSGFTNESMTRSHAWTFLQLGRRIERAFQTSEVLAATLATPTKPERPVLESVLKSTDSLMTYRSRYLARLQPEAVLDLLVTDATNPRAIVFQLSRIVEMIRGLPDRKDAGLELDERIAETLLHQIRMVNPTEMTAVDDQGQRSTLADRLRDLIEDLPKLSDAITARYLIHTGTQDLTGYASRSK